MKLFDSLLGIKIKWRIWQTHSIKVNLLGVYISQRPTLTLILVSVGGPSAPRANDFFRFSLTSVSLSSSSTLSSSFCLHSVSSSANRCSTPWPAHTRSQHWHKSYVRTVLCVWVVSDLWRSSSPPSPPSSPCGGKSVHSWAPPFAPPAPLSVLGIAWRPPLHGSFHTVRTGLHLMENMKEHE